MTQANVSPSGRLKSLSWLMGLAAALASLPAVAAQPLEWEQVPRMTLERQFAGPMQDTLIQRWRDPVDGSICYIYLPISAAHSAKTDSGYVQYGANVIGSVSCMPGPRADAKPAQSQKK